MTTSTQTSSAWQSLRAQPLKLAQTIGYFMALLALGLSTATIGPTLGILASHTGSTLAQVSVVFTARAFGYMVGSLVGGHLYDRIKGNPIVGTAFIVMALMWGIAPVISQLWLLALVLVLLSICDGIVDVGCNTLLVWTHTDHVGPFMNALHFFFGIGAFVTPIIAAQVINATGDVHWVYWIVALAVLLPGIWNLRTASPSSVAHHEASKEHPPEDMRFVLIIGVFFFAAVAAEVTFTGWIASYAVAIGFGNDVQAAVLTSVFWGGFILARLVSIPLATRMSARAMLWANLAICAVCTVLLMLGGNSSAVLWIGTFGLGVGIAPLFPTMISYAGTRMAITGKVTSIFLAGSSIGGMTLPWVIGQVFVPIGPITMLWAVLFCVVLTGAIVLFTQRYKARV